MTLHISTALLIICTSSNESTECLSVGNQRKYFYHVCYYGKRFHCLIEVAMYLFIKVSREDEEKIHFEEEVNKQHWDLASEVKTTYPDILALRGNLRCRL